MFIWCKWICMYMYIAPSTYILFTRQTFFQQLWSLCFIFLYLVGVDLRIKQKWQTMWWVCYSNISRTQYPVLERRPTKLFSQCLRFVFTHSAHAQHWGSGQAAPNFNSADNFSKLYLLTLIGRILMNFSRGF